MKNLLKCMHYALFKLYAELYDVELSILRDLNELVLALLNSFIILLIVMKNNHNLILNQFK